MRARVPATPLSLRLLAGAADEMAALQAVFEAAPGYFRAVSGAPAPAGAAIDEFVSLPPGKRYADKRCWGLYAGDAMVGCADALRGWNAPHKAVVGLLLLADSWQGRGLGRAFNARVEAAIAGWPEITTLRLGIISTNTEAFAFWRRMGYAETGESRPGAPDFIGDVVVLEKPLPR